MPETSALAALGERLKRRPRDVDAAFELARLGHALGHDERALPEVERTAELTGDPALWQWAGVLSRECDRSDRAAEAFARVLAQRPRDAAALHGAARAALEAGRPSVQAFEAAHAVAPLDADVLSGLALARHADGALDAAIGGLASTLLEHPGWYAGHELAAQLRWLRGDGEAFTATIERALGVAPLDPLLWTLLVEINLRAERYDAAQRITGRARGVLTDQPFLDLADATIASDRGETSRADALFARLPPGDDETAVVRRIRHALRCGRIETAQAIGEAALSKPYARSVIPYLGLAWRMTGDARAFQLDDPALVATVDLHELGVDVAALASVLRRLHGRGGQQFDQSVRGGTQTAGHLFKRAEPEIVALRSAVVHAVQAYAARLPAVDNAHPSFGGRHGQPVRFSGAWSVRLAHGGNHAAHVHPAGWLSSAIYVSVDRAMEVARSHDGFLAIGAPPADLWLDLAPHRLIEPVVGRMVLFPSTTWHSTYAFSGGERMTAAFDVAQARVAA